MNIKQAIEKVNKSLKENNIEEAFFKSKILVSFLINKNKEYLITHDTQELTKEEEEKLNIYISRLIKNEPIQYITENQEFMGLKFKVNKNVLIPQPDTEILVEEVINIIKNENFKDLKILDLCTGSGAIGVSLAKYIESSKIILSDISSKALEIAKYNVIKNVPEKNIEIKESDLFEEIKNKFNIIVSNPPYIETDIIKTLSKEVQNEPLLALDGGNDGLDIYRKIVNEACNYLEDDGYLALEIGYNQKNKVIELIEKTNMYKGIYSKKDLAGNDRIIICKLK